MPIFLAQLHIGSRASLKVCLNYCSRRWLMPTLNLFNNLIPLELLQLQTLSWNGYINLIFVKDIKTSWFFLCFVNLVPFNYSRRKNIDLRKTTSYFKVRNIFHVTCKVWYARHRNNTEQVFKGLTVKDLIKISEFLRPLFFSEKF